MKRFYSYIAAKMSYFGWGRTIVNHIRRHGWFYENFEALYTALILALLIKAFLFEAYKIPSGSMKDTLLVDDRIFVNKFVYKFDDIDVGDIVVFRTKGIPEIDDPEKPYYIKRVVGLPGDTVVIGLDGLLYRNGDPITKPQIFVDNRYFPIQRGADRKFEVPDGHILVFGDNSRNSYDSRGWGCVPLENVMGKAVFRYWPLKRMGLIKGVPPELIRAEVARERDERNPLSNAHAAEN